MYFFQSYRYEDTMMNLELKRDWETCTTTDNLIEICESNDPIKWITILHKKTSCTLNSRYNAGQILLWYGYFSGLGHSSSTHGLSVWVELAGASLFCVGKRRYSSSSALMATLSGDSQRLNCSKALQDRQDWLITHEPKSWLD